MIPTPRKTRRDKTQHHTRMPQRACTHVCSGGDSQQSARVATRETDGQDKRQRGHIPSKTAASGHRRKERFDQRASPSSSLPHACCRPIRLTKRSHAPLLPSPALGRWRPQHPRRMSLCSTFENVLSSGQLPAASASMPSMASISVSASCCLSIMLQYPCEAHLPTPSRIPQMLSCRDNNTTSSQELLIYRPSQPSGGRQAVHLPCSPILWGTRGPLFAPRKDYTVSL